jgi:MinD-like ATPase involved in chromosome partitioning or flagellar assembly
VVVISDQPRLDRAVVRALGRHGVAIVGVPSSADAATRLLSLGVGTVTAVGAGVDEVVSAIAESIREPMEIDDTIPGPDGSGTGAIVAVWGPMGAPGRTTLAVNLANELSSITGSTVLLDADTYGGAVAQALGMLDEAPGIAAVARVALEGGSLASAFHRFALEVRPGLRVLTGITQARALADLGDTVTAIPRLVVVNRVRASVCGARPAQAVGDVLARYAAIKEVWIVPDDPKACDAATLAGSALAERAPHSSARKAIEAIARRVWADVSMDRVVDEAADLKEARV